MGGRGAFADSNNQNFTFVEGGQTYRTIKKYKGFETIEKIDQTKNTAIPFYSHSGSNIYVVVQQNKIKNITVYGENHNVVTSIDFYKKHHGVIPHTHPHGIHTNDGPGIPPTEEEWKLIRYIKKKTRLKCFNDQSTN
ncbi:MAG: hypothetical protein LUC31_03040 [Coprobacillus sp.]|nr:hypothetical protein [Coprobacillus sp.]